MTPSLANAIAVDAGNAACRKRGAVPSSTGPWPSNEWNDDEWGVYYSQLAQCWRLIDLGIAAAMAAELEP